MTILQESIIYLLAAIISVPISKRLGFGSVLGYLCAGILIGPFGFGFVHEPEHILHFASDSDVDHIASTFREADEKLLVEQFELQDSEDKLIQSTRDAARELETILEQDLLRQG